MTPNQEKDYLSRMSYNKVGKWFTVYYGEVKGSGILFYIVNEKQKELLGLTFKQSKENIRNW